MRRYQGGWLGGDVLAGILLAAIAIPEQMATARLANMPPASGLYAFAAGSIAFALFGLNRYVSAGADSTIAPIFAGTIAALVATSSAQYPQFVGLVALFSGVILIGAGILRAGWIADLLSIPVVTGFLAGIAVHIVVGQLPLILGIPQVQGPLPLRLVSALRAAPQANIGALAVGTAVLAIMWLCDRLSPRIPGGLIALGGAGIAAALLRLPAHGVAMLGALPHVLPKLQFPAVALSDEVRLVPLAAIVALVCIVQIAAVVRLFPSEGEDSADLATDFAAVGAGSVIASLLGAFAVNASPPRTAVVREAGGRSQVAGLVAVAVVALLLFGFSQVTGFLPQAALGGVLVFIGLRIFRLDEIVRIARSGGVEVWFLVAATLMVVVLPIEIGMALGIGLSLARGVYVIARPPSAELEHLRGTTIWWPPGEGEDCERVPGVVVFAPVAPIAFTNAQYIVARLQATLAKRTEHVRLVIVEGGGIIDVDYTGAKVPCRDDRRSARGRHRRCARALIGSARPRGRAANGLARCDRHGARLQVGE